MTLNLDLQPLFLCSRPHFAAHLSVRGGATTSARLTLNRWAIISVIHFWITAIRTTQRWPPVLFDLLCCNNIIVILFFCSFWAWGITQRAGDWIFALYSKWCSFVQCLSRSLLHWSCDHFSLNMHSVNVRFKVLSSVSVEFDAWFSDHSLLHPSLGTVTVKKSCRVLPVD